MSADSDVDPANAPAPTSPDGSTPSLPFLVVGIGASAGGLEAISELLQALPRDPGLCFLYVQHLEPRHESQLASILSRISSLSVREAEEGVKVERNHFYIIPPNKMMTLSDGHLRLAQRPPRGLAMPVDHLFRSLAEVQGSQAIGVILSGGGTDGTLGFRAIKAEGGITFAQEEQSAKHNGMPRSVVADGCVDYVLAPAQIATELVRVAEHPYVRPLAPTPIAEQLDDGDHLNQIIALLRSGTDVDFTNYKRTTINRRIQRRMALRNVENVEEYIQILRNELGELNALYQDFLIRVTQFFRDPEAFEVLKDKVFPGIAQNRSPDRPIRIWIAGCATGEEVYSIAICLLEYLGTRSETVPIKILATDLNELALDRARAGIYIDNIDADVSVDRLRRFFHRVDGHYQIARPSATCASSRGTTWQAIRRSRTSISSVAGTF
jgi:two-component system CheB/CheR fusion protein